MFSAKKGGSVSRGLIGAFETEQPHREWVSAAHSPVVRVKANSTALVLAVK